MRRSRNFGSINGVPPVVVPPEGTGTAWTTVFGTTLATDAVTISAGDTVRLDGNHLAQSIDVLGTLIIPVNISTSLTTGYINIGANGVLMTDGGATLPPQYTHTITLNGTEVSRTARTVSGTSLGFTNNGVGRSIQVQPGGKLNLFGTSPTIKRTKLNAHAAASTNTFTLADSTGWLAGDEIVIGTTDFYGVSVPEKLTLQSNASGTTVQTTTTIASARWGALQYVTDSGMSLTAGTLTGAPAGIGTASATPTTVDERAMVINLTRNIVIQGANDTAWTTSKFGAHCMFMGRTSDIKLDGVQFRRVGQAGAIGRYPIHWHMMSYDMSAGMNVPSPTGTFLGAVVGEHYAKNCSISESGQRMIVLHGTHGVTLDANVGFDITGHAIFLEDGAEQDNVITNNVVMKVRAPTSGNKLLNHDVAATAAPLGVNSTIGSACYWNTNPQNTFQNNWANDSAGAGFWSAFSEQCFGLSINVALNPMYTPITLIDGTVSMGHAGAGQLTNDRVFNDKGDTGQQRYMATFLGNPIKNLQLYKNSSGGYSNRIDEGKYQNFICADNAGMDVFGQATIETSVMVNTLVVAESLNNTNSKRLSSYKAAFATYHELLNFKNIIAVGYKYIDGAQDYGTSTFTGGGLFRIWDLYTQGIFTFSENTGFKLIDCTPPFRTLSPFKDGATMFNRNWAIAGAVKDTTGALGNAGSWWIYNDPFLNYNATSPTLVNSSAAANGQWTTDPYYNVSQFKNSTDLNLYSFQGAIGVSRQDSGGAEVGNWNVPDGNTAVFLGNMRHFAAAKGGRYLLTFPGQALGNYCEFNTFGQLASTDIFLIGVPFDCSLTPVVYQQGAGILRDGTNRGICTVGSTAGAVASGQGRYLTATGSMANVVADTTGLIYYKDTAANTIWMQVRTSPIVAATSYGTGILGNAYKLVLVIVTV